jgi:hypothetical protein
MAVAMEQLSKYISAEMNIYNNRRVVLSERSVPRAYKKGKEDRLSQLSFEMQTCQDMSFGTEELNSEIEASEL